MANYVVVTGTHAAHAALYNTLEKQQVELNRRQQGPGSDMLRTAGSLREACHTLQQERKRWYGCIDGCSLGSEILLCPHGIIILLFGQGPRCFAWPVLFLTRSGSALYAGEAAAAKLVQTSGRPEAAVALSLDVASRNSIDEFVSRIGAEYDQQVCTALAHTPRCLSK